jgi:hypothetical protein
MLILLSRQDVGNEVVPVEKPPASEYVQDVKVASASSTPVGGGRSAPGLGGEGGVSFNFLLEREKMGGDSLQEAEAGEAIVRKR